MPRNTFDWEANKETILNLLKEGKTYDQVLDYIADNLNYFPEKSYLITKVRKWKEQSPNG